MAPRFLPSLEGKAGRRSATSTQTSAWAGGQDRGTVYNADWGVGRAVSVGMGMNVWVFRAVDAIASNASGLPFMVRRGDPITGEPFKDHPILPLFNKKPNPFQDAWTFRYALSAQLLLSKMGAFVEVVRSRRGDPIALSLLQPGTVVPIPDAKKYVSGYMVQAGSEQVELPPERVLWIKLPHPVDPYMGMTPLEAAGLSIETDILAKQFNRNFLQNDGRPGGILAIKGGIEEEDAEVLRNRFLGPRGTGVAGAGRLTVLETGEQGVDFVDTATTPRDAQYNELLSSTKQEILIAFGVPEAVIGNASGRTYDNAGVETEVFWRETMLPHLQLLGRSLDELTADPDDFAAFDVSAIYILDRDKREQHKYYLEELKAGAISIDTYLEKTGQKKIGDDHRYILNNLVPYNPDGKPDIQQGVPEGAQPVRDPLAPDSPTDGTTGNPNTDGDPSTGNNAVGSGAADKPPAQPRRLPAGSAKDAHDILVKEAVAISHAAAVPIDRVLGVAAADDRPLLAPAEKTVPWGPFDVRPDSLKVHKRMLRSRIASWERHVKRQMDGYFTRQERVVTEKLTGRKSRERWAETKALDVDDVFDRARWDDQLDADAGDWVQEVMSDFGSEVADALGGEWDPDAALRAAEGQRKRILLVNRTTQEQIGRVLDQATEKRVPLEDVAAAVAAVFAMAREKRAATIATTEVTAAANRGAIVAAKLTGTGRLTKTWTTLGDDRVRDSHDDADGDTVGLDARFTVGGGILAYPGDPAGPPEETVQCRCLLTIGTESGPIGVDGN